jgi:hypothetical protein
VVGGGAGGDGMGGGVVVQLVHAGGERLPGRFFLFFLFRLLLANFGVLMASMFSQDSIQCPLMKQAAAICDYCCLNGNFCPLLKVRTVTVSNRLDDFLDEFDNLLRSTPDTALGFA